MVAKRTRALDARYDGLTGVPLLDALAEGEETPTLEAFWRYGNPQAAADVAGPMLASGSAHLYAMVLDEIITPLLDPPAPQAILNAISTHQPALAKEDAERLAERLREENPLDPRYEPGRPTLLAWLLAQPGVVGDEAGIDVIAGRIVGSEDGNVREAAYARCRADMKVLKAAAEAVTEAFDAAPGDQTWQLAGVEFTEKGCRELDTAPPVLAPLVRRLIETAPSWCPTPQLPETLRRLVLDSALDDVEAILEQELSDTPGARALLDLIPHITPAGRRTRDWAAAARRQISLWPVLQQQTTSWEVDEWRRVLGELARLDAVHPQALSYLVPQAPVELTAFTMRLVIVHVAIEDSLVGTMGQRLQERLAALGDDHENREEWVAAAHWPKRRDEEELAKFDAITSHIEASLHVRLLVYGYLAGKLHAAVAARLIPAGHVGRALEIVDLGRRGEWVAALADAHPEEIADAAGAVTTPESYDLDVVAALAPTRADTAFAGVRPAWPHLAPEQRDRLLELIEQHGTLESIDALCAVIEDDHRDNARRRARAARRVGRLVRAGDTIPEPVLELLNSNVPDLRAAAVEVIERVRPRDPELIGRLHDVASAPGVAGKAARSALDALGREFLDEFAATSDKAELAGLMPLLGAVGRQSVLGPLFGYLGGGAVYDDRALHQQAAAAVRSAADRIEDVGTDEQEMLVALIDGEEQEADPEARSALSEALARLQLGEDASLKVLYDEIKITPNTSPDRLYGEEKGALVRQLALLHRACQRGQDGWGAELAHRDNVAERLVRAAYLVSDGTSANIAEQIRNDTRVDYGSLITALASTTQLNGIQASCRVLHDARSEHSEIPHAGHKPDEQTMTAARQAYLKVAKVCIGTLKAPRGA